MKKLLAILLSVGILIGTVSLTAFTANLTPEITIEEFTEQLSEMNKEYKDEPVSNRLIVKSKHDIPILDGVDIVEGYNDLHIIQFDNSTSAAEALEYYQKAKNTEYVESCKIVTTLDDKISSSSKSYGEHLSWGSEVIGVDDYIDYLGDVNSLPEIDVAIIDTGIDYEHEFLKDRVIRTEYNHSGSGEENSEMDDKGHGTHVAGIVADNTTENVKIRGYKVLNSNGSGDIIDAVIAVYQATEDGNKVINMSLGMQGKSSAMEDAVHYATEHDVTVCVSAGNSGMDAKEFTPAGINECITVAAMDEEWVPPYWTNWGAMIDVVAPGVDINSTVPGNSYKSYSGTSMACPFAAAASALILSRSPDLNCDDVCSIIEENSIDIMKPLLTMSVLYIGEISSYGQNRSPQPEFSMETGKYHDAITVEITCSDASADIYYTLNGARASNTNGTLYTEPITIDKVTTLHATAYSAGKLKSLQTVARYYITTPDPDDMFEINEEGIVTKYRGNNHYLTIPNVINGVTVRGIGKEVFKLSDMVMIKLPDTLEIIGDNAFEGCAELYSVNANGIKTISEYAFDSCEELREIDISKVDNLGECAFWFCRSLIDINCCELTEVPAWAFYMADSAVNVNLPKAKSVGENALGTVINANEIYLPSVEYLSGGALSVCCSITKLYLPNLIELEDGYDNGSQFAWCDNLQVVYMPKVKNISHDAFYTDFQLQTVFAPMAETLNNVPWGTNNQVKYYLNNLIEYSNDLKQKNKTYSVRVIAPKDSVAETMAITNGFEFTDSDTMVDTIGTHTDENGNTVFEFGWNNIDDIEWYADVIAYSAEGSAVGTTIGRPLEKDGVTYFQVIGENELRGCVDIDGMVFRSAPLTIGENESEPENDCEHNWQIVYTVSVPNDNIVVFRCLKCNEYYRVSFADHLNDHNFPLLDLNNDGIVNAKDLAYIMKRAK